MRKKSKEFKNKALKKKKKVKRGREETQEITQFQWDLLRFEWAVKHLVKIIWGQSLNSRSL